MAVTATSPIVFVAEEWMCSLSQGSALSNQCCSGLLLIIQTGNCAKRLGSTSEGEHLCLGKVMHSESCHVVLY